MSTRVTKKMVTPFEMCRATGVVLLMNLYDPQIPTLRLFLEAVEQAQLPCLVVGNKLDLVTQERVQEVQRELGQEFLVMSLLTGKNVSTVVEKITQRFPEGARIVVLGIFNSGKNEPHRPAYWEESPDRGPSRNDPGVRGARVERPRAHRLCGSSNRCEPALHGELRLHGLFHPRGDV